MTTRRELMHIYELDIVTTPEALWRAITSADWTKRYFYGTSVESSWSVGSPVVYRNSDGTTALEGHVVELIPLRRLVTTFVMTDHHGASDSRPSRVTWEIQQHGDICTLTLTHDDFKEETETFRRVRSGWDSVLSGLQGLLEGGLASATEPRSAADVGPGSAARVARNKQGANNGGHKD